MDKRLKMNQIVKDSITEALFFLMKDKNFSDITITEIIKKAGVARVSYYRNYKSKEHIIENYVFDFLQEFKEKFQITNDSDFNVENFIMIFDLVRKRFKELKTIFESGLSGLFLNSLNNYFEESNFKNEGKIVNRWKFYAANGSFFNIINKWVMEDMKENPQVIIQALMPPINK